MKITITCIATVILAASAFSQIESNVESTQDYEQDIACSWFPICRDPEFQQQLELETKDVYDFQTNPEVLISCSWFPICRDPDQQITDEVATLVLV